MAPPDTVPAAVAYVPDAPATPFADLRFPEPAADTLAARYAAIDAAFDRGGRAGAHAAWEAARREYGAWAALARIHFEQDTADPEAVRRRALVDALDPVVQGHDTALKSRLLDEPGEALAGEVGPHVVSVWRADRGTFAAEIAADLGREAALGAEYTALAASARLVVEGETVNLSGLAPFAEHRDRDVRLRAASAKWDFFAAHAETFDRLYADLVTLRTRIARTLGDADFVPLGYRRMRRLDYGPGEVAAFRDAVRRTVVPLLARLRERQRRDAGWERFQAWDEPLRDPRGNPAPIGGHDALVDAGHALFARLDGRVAALFRRMAEAGYLDLRTRPAKAPGGFCDVFPIGGMPFVFANFNGTAGDIDVLTHEIGHAVQMWESRTQPRFDALMPTMDTAEINSMGLELLVAPHADLLVGPENADRFRRLQLFHMLDIVAQCALGDHFQHEIYADPDATTAERHATWRRLEQDYLPWRDWGPLAHPAAGGGWQAISHFYGVPFYYIDYALAACCALQLWERARHDRAGAFDAWMRLAPLGGSLPFGGLLDEAGLRSPFAPGVLDGVVAAAARALGEGDGAL